MRADAALWRAGQVHQHDLRLPRFPRAAQQLLDEFRAALAHAQRAQRPVARVAVRA